LLVVALSVPGYNRSGGDYWIYTLLGILARRHQVTLLALYPHPPQEQEEYQKAIEQLGVEVVVGLRQRSLKDLLARGYDAAILEFYYVSEMIADDIRFYQPQLPIAIDTHDVHFLREARMAQVLNDAQMLAESETTRRRELAAYRKADLLIVRTPYETQALLHQEASFEIFTAPVMFAVRGESLPEKRQPNSLLFVGWFKHPPNVDGLLYFCDEILPLVKKALPEVRLTVVGGDAPPEIQALSSETVRLTGRVESVTPYLDSHRVAIAPLRYGAGMKTKVIESLASGVPTVTTSVGAEGIGLVHGRHAFIADTPDEFAQAIVRLCQDDELWRQVSVASRRFVEQHCSLEVAERQIEVLVERLTHLRPKRLTLVEKLPIYRRKAWAKAAALLRRH
ncbi:MAG: glycosyltransferase family 4 protein, partial [Abditibacteriales bacterium]|nr:glycosyltransferase family 4 protein [Abditibacteriales bacterium]MDW8368091.1 glycosyltransferase [Abditibacteriales bacterium]